MTTIVVGVDGSAASLRALRCAADIAEGLDAELVAVFARHMYLAMPEHVAEAMYRDLLDESEHDVAAAVDGECANRRLRYRFESHEGPPAEVLEGVAERVGAILTVVGRSGWSTFTEFFLGSVSNRLAHRTDRPVLLV